MDMGIKHLFFNTFEPFTNVLQYSDWDSSYLDPYNPRMTYYNWLTDQGFQTVRPDSYHFGADAHRAWAEFLYQNMVHKALTS